MAAALGRRKWDGMEEIEGEQTSFVFKCKEGEICRFEEAVGFALRYIVNLILGTSKRIM